MERRIESLNEICVPALGNGERKRQRRIGRTRQADETGVEIVGYLDTCLKIQGGKLHLAAQQCLECAFVGVDQHQF